MSQAPAITYLYQVEADKNDLEPKKLLNSTPKAKWQYLQEAMHLLEWWESRPPTKPYPYECEPLLHRDLPYARALIMKAMDDKIP